MLRCLTSFGLLKMKTVLEFNNLSFAYPGGKTVFHDINLAIFEGDFILLCGPTGSGKTTLLRHAKLELTPVGKRSGIIRRIQDTGFVMQNPENQIVMDTVFEELCFGMENDGMDPIVIRRRVAEVSAFFGLEDMMDTPVHDLSEGEKQLLSLAASTALRPGLLVLDEPTSMLDPVARQSFWEMLVKLNRELGIAVLVSEHSLDEVLSLCDRALLLKEGTICLDAAPREFAGQLSKEGFFEMLPEPAKLAFHLGIVGNLPLNVREAKNILSDKNIISLHDLRPHQLSGLTLYQNDSSKERSPWETQMLKAHDPSNKILSAHDVWFSYGNEKHFALSGASFYLEKAEIHALLGGNGSGKSTLLRLLSGLSRPFKGKIKVRGKTALLLQDPKAMFWNDELFLDLFSIGKRFGKSPDEVHVLMKRFDLDRFEKRHPYDLSGGEMQKAALVKLLLTDADILLLDEPTKGVDALQKKELEEIFKELKKDKKSLVLVTHDLSFAASCADRCTLLSRGKTACTDETSGFFKGNYFYTTDVNRITHTCVIWEEASWDDAAEKGAENDAENALSKEIPHEETSHKEATCENP